MDNKLLSIGETAKLLGVSVDTLRRWDANGRLRSVRAGVRGHRFYRQSDVARYMQDVEVIAWEWASSLHAFELSHDVYCQTRDIFQARLETLQSRLTQIAQIEIASLLTAVVGEIGNNSFDHNLGNWPDIPGIFFAYSLRNRKVVLADRGQGILTTLKRARAALSSSSEALQVAFTETISGRHTENRGNGLKFVKKVIVSNPFELSFQTGDAMLSLKQGDVTLNVRIEKTEIPGCFAIISFEEAIKEV